MKDELIQLLKDYIEFLVENSKSSFAIVYPHLQDSDEVIQKGKDFRNKLRNSLEAANKLMDLGFIPFVPLLSHFQHMMFPRPYEDWLKLDIVWLESCDCLLRLPGESKGADKEVRCAFDLGIPFFATIEEIVEYYK